MHRIKGSNPFRSTPRVQIVMYLHSRCRPQDRSGRAACRGFGKGCPGTLACRDPRVAEPSGWASICAKKKTVRQGPPSQQKPAARTGRIDSLLRPPVSKAWAIANAAPVGAGREVGGRVEPSYCATALWAHAAWAGTLDRRPPPETSPSLPPSLPPSRAAAGRVRGAGGGSMLKYRRLGD